MILVTGVRHSGTTFVMQIARECGYDLGEPLHSVSDRQGLEWNPWRGLASRIALAMGARLEPSPGWAKIDFEKRKEVSDRFAAEIVAMDWPEIVKFPEQGQATLLGLVRPTHTIVCVRSPEGWADSMRKQNGPAKSMSVNDLVEGMAQKVGWLIVSLEQAELPYTVVQYPRLARDRQYAIEKLGPIFGGVDFVWGKVVNPTWDRR